MSEVSALIGQHYAFAAGRTGVLRQLLISQPDVDRMLGSHGIQELNRVLTEMKFTNIIPQGLASTEGMLPALEQWVKNEVAAMVPESKRHIFTILWTDGDAPTLAWMLKKKYELTLLDSTEPTTGLHAFSVNELHDLVKTGTPHSLPYEIVAGVEKVKAMNPKKAKMIDTVVDQAIAAYKTRIAKESGSRLILDFVQNTIDTTNIRTIVRSLPALHTSALLPGGTMNLQKVKTMEELRSQIVQSGIFGFSVDLSILLRDSIAFERAVADLIAKDIAEMWSMPMTVEPVFAFAAIALSHIALVRAVSIGKRAGLSPQEIKQVLPPFIPASSFRS